MRLAYNPVAKRVVYETSDSYYSVPGRHGMAWDYMGTELEQRARYDPDSMRLAIARHGSIANLCKAMCPHLNGERLKRLIQNIQSISHAKQRAYTNDVQRLARALSKQGKRKLRESKKRNALKELKALLASK